MSSTERLAVDYPALARQLAALLEGEEDVLASLANTSALVAQTLPDLNWAGFYVRRGEELVLGPFQGKVACTRIPWGRGVCGTAAARDEVLTVADVQAFDGHIACDPASRSELVVPLHADGAVWGVLDLDSPHPGRFTDADARGLAEVVRILEPRLEAGRP